MGCYKFTKDSVYGYMVMDFDIPSEYNKTNKIIKSRKDNNIPNKTKSKYITPPGHFIAFNCHLNMKKYNKQKRKEKIEERKKERDHINRWPRPSHFWAMVKFLCDKYKQLQLDKENKKINISPHYLAFQHHIGSNLGTKILKKNCPKISTLWKVEFLRRKLINNRYNLGLKIIPKLEGKYPFLINIQSKILDNYLTICLSNNEEFQNDENVFDTRDLL